MLHDHHELREKMDKETVDVELALDDKTIVQLSLAAHEHKMTLNDFIVKVHLVFRLPDAYCLRFYFFNVPGGFAQFWNVISFLMNERTKAKAQFIPVTSLRKRAYFRPFASLKRMLVQPRRVGDLMRRRCARRSASSRSAFPRGPCTRPNPRSSTSGSPSMSWPFRRDPASAQTGAAVEGSPRSI